MYHYEGCGLPDVFLKNGYEIAKTRYGTGVIVHDVEGLHAALAEAIVTNPLPLVGCEFRFLRQQLELSQASLGGLLGRDEQAVARWEKGKVKVDPVAERLLRRVYQETNKGNHRLKPIIEMLQKLETVPPQPKKFVAGEEKDNWHVESKCVGG